MTTEQEIQKLQEAVERLRTTVARLEPFLPQGSPGVGAWQHSEHFKASSDVRAALRETEGLSSNNNIPAPPTYTMEQVEKAISRLMTVRDEWDSLTKESVAFTLRHCLKGGKW